MITRTLFLFLFLKIALLGSSQKKELRLSINTGPIWTRLVVNPKGVFAEQNQPYLLTDLLLTYQKNRSHFSVGYSGFYIHADINLSNSFALSSSRGGRVNSIVTQFSYDIYEFKKQNIVIQSCIGNYFIFKGNSGFLENWTNFFQSSLNINGTPISSPFSANAVYTKERPNNLMLLPFVGFSLRKEVGKKIVFGFGFKRTIGIQKFEEAKVLYREPNQPDQNFSIINRGGGNQFLISASVRLWQKKNSKAKQPLSPFDY